jgi:ABC-type oligopeptide transport system substrate-binding subunit
VDAIMTHAFPLLFSRCLATLALLAAGVALAQAPKKPIKEEEEETRPKPKAIRIEEEEPKPAPKKAPLVSPTARAADLVQEARSAKNPKLRELFQALAVPHESVTMLPNLSVRQVAPVGEFVGDTPKFGNLTLQELDRDGKPFRSYSVRASDVQKIEHYEQLAVKRVDAFLQSGLDKSPGTANYLPRLDMLQEAEKVLATVLRFHDSGRPRTQDWQGVGESLRQRLLAVQIEQVDALADSRRFDAAQELGRQLGEAYPGRPEVGRALVRARLRLAEQVFQDGKEAELLRLGQEVERLDRDLAGHGERDADPLKQRLAALRQRMQTRARECLDRALALAKKNASEALRQLRTAEILWPDAPGLAEAYQALGQSRALMVGVRYLPQTPQLSPATACCEVERQALDLLFESLVRPLYDAAVGQRFQPELAVSLPRLVPMGRQFQLVGDARWSNGEPLTAADVLGTVQLLKDPGWAGRVPEWDDLVQMARVEDAAQVQIVLRRGYLDPLALMTFKILPAGRLKRMDDADFAEKPIGSGPYQYSGRAQYQGRDCLMFEANPHYRNRPGRAGRPFIPAVQFFESKDPVLEFQRGLLHLLVDFSPQQIAALNAPEARLPPIQVVTLRNRRVWFLAVNHRRGNLQSLELRKALSAGIDRERILNEVFRAPGQAEPMHRWLNGPFPRGCWACAPELDAETANPHRPEVARSLAQAARASGMKLTLKYPAGDARVRAACTAIKDQLDPLGLQIELREREPRLFRNEVEREHDFDLAYTHWDYADESYWLWPLLDPRGAERGGRNYLGYVNDGQLESLFRRALDHRQFDVVEKRYHDLHRHFSERLPFIPLWQLDTCLAIHPDLQTVPAPRQLDPLALFAEAGQWRLEKQTAAR